jgi:hypothetical protein
VADLVLVRRMTRPLILIALVLNTAVVVVAMVAYALVHHDRRTIDTQQLQQRVAARLASATDPLDMQSSSATIAKMVASGHRAVQSSADVVDRTLGFLALVGALNITFVLAGMWHHKNVLRRNSSNKSLEPTSGRRDV